MKLEDAIKTNKFSSQKHKAGLNILYTAWWIKTIISQELKGVGLTHEQFNVLRILKGTHPEEMCVKDIGSRMIERSSNVPRIIDRLVVKNYVERSTSNIDKRETVIRLTGAGIDVLKVGRDKIEKLIGESMQIDETGAEQLNELLETLRAKE